MAAGISSAHRSSCQPARQGQVHDVTGRPLLLQQHQHISNQSANHWCSRVFRHNLSGFTALRLRQPMALVLRSSTGKSTAVTSPPDSTAGDTSHADNVAYQEVHGAASEASRIAASQQLPHRSRAAQVLMSTNAENDAQSQMAGFQSKPWWAPHQQVLQIFGSSFWAACLLAGGFYWIMWAIRSNSSKLKSSSAAADASQGHDDVGSTAKAVADTLDNPWAPISFILHNTFGQNSKVVQGTQDAERGSQGKGGVALPLQRQGLRTQAAAVALRTTQRPASNAADPTAAAATVTAAGRGTTKTSGTDKSIATAGDAEVQAPAWQLPDRWWADLAKVHYINFGAKCGILPFLQLETTQASEVTPAGPSTPSRRLLVAFADKVDAEYVSSSIRRGMELAQAPHSAAMQLNAAAAVLGASSKDALGAPQSASTPLLHVPRPLVVACSPSHLEDVSRMQQAELAVVPQGVLQQYYAAQLSDEALEQLLTDIITGALLSVPPITAAAIGHDAVAAGPARTQAALKNAVSASTRILTPTASSATATSARTKGQKLPSRPSLKSLNATMASPSVQPLPAADLAVHSTEQDGVRTGTSSNHRLRVGAKGIDQSALKGLAQAVQSGNIPATADDMPPIPPVFDFPGFEEPAAMTQAPITEPAAANGDSEAWRPHTNGVTTSVLNAASPAVVDSSSSNNGSSSSSSAIVGGSSNSSSRGSSSIEDRDKHSSNREQSSSSQPPHVTPQVIDPPAVGTGPMVQASARLIQEDGMVQSSAAEPSHAPGGEAVEGSEDMGTETDPLLQEYQRFKKAFIAKREAGWQRPAPAANVPTDSTTDTSSPLQADNEAATSDTSTPAPSTRRKTQAERVQEVLDKSGPTDAALQEALKVVGMPDPETTDALVDEWYKILQAEEAGLLSEEALASAANAAGAARKPSQRGAARQAVAAAAAAKHSSQGNGMGTGSTKTLAEMQVQLQGLQSQLQQLMQAASTGAPVSQQAAQLQQQMNELMSDMAGASSGQNASPTASPSPSSSSSSGTESSKSPSPEPQAKSPAQPIAGSSSQMPVGAAATQGSTPAATGWGAGWKRKPLGGNRGLLSKQPNHGSPPPAPPTDAAPQPAAVDGRGGKQQQASRDEQDGQDGQDAAEDKSVVVSKRAGRERPWKKERDPAERQATIKEALRFVSSNMANKDDDTAVLEEYDDEGNRLPAPDPNVDRIAGIDWDRVKRASRDSSEGGSTSTSKAGLNSTSSQAAPRVDTGAQKWWQRRFQALFLPNIRYEDGSVGFLQLDCSLVDGKRDMRVVTFEDRHDCMHCLTIMKQWPEYQWHELEMGMLPTNAVESEIVRAWQAQVEAGATATRPAGVVVFRRGKLAMRVGMTQEQFTQLVVFQAAAQLSLSKVGYEFDDF